MDKTISLDSLQRLIIMPLKRLIDKKVTMVDGKELSTNDFTNEEKAKLAGIETGAQANPTKVSELENDAGYITAEEVPSGLPEVNGPYKQLVTDSEGKTVWEDKLTAFPTKTITWDGDHNNRLAVGYQETTRNDGSVEVEGYFKISDEILTPEQFQNNFEFVFVNQMTGLPPTGFLTDQFVSWDAYDTYGRPRYPLRRIPWIMAVPYDGANFGGFVFPEAGIYAYKHGVTYESETRNNYVSSFTYKSTKESIRPEYIIGTELTEADNGKVLGAVDGKIGLVEIVDTTARQEITQLSEGKVDKTYVVELFEELKELILSGNTSGAIALLDQAILDQAVLS